MSAIKITETILRDAHQSQAATRMRLQDMLPAAGELDKIGYHSVECWGGATFDTAIRYLREDPWHRLRALREAMPNTKLQMLLRGQNLLGYKHYADDIVDMFVKKSIENGIDIIRVFDALNDLRNLEQAIKSIKKYKGICEASFCYTISPAHNIDYFVRIAKQLQKMGADIICIKDMANLLLPYPAYELVKALKSEVGLPIHVHTHNTAGTGAMVYLKCIEAGAEIIDTALSPFANGTSQPATESMIATLAGTQYDTGLSLESMYPAVRHFEKIADRLKQEGFINDKVMTTDVNALIYQVPGGMISNLISQLEKQGALDKYNEVMQEVPKVRQDIGYPPLVTPSSQIVGIQAVLNVLSGERYKMVTKEFKSVLKGEYGSLLFPPSEELLNKTGISKEEIITCRPADMIKPEYNKLKSEIKQYYTQEEDVLTYAMFPQVALDYFKWRQARDIGVDAALMDRENNIHPI
jgi:oxaloacetate decarboxylase alpha subunit